MLAYAPIVDALHNLAPDSGASADYCRGLVVGVVASLIASGFDYPTAVRVVASSVPANYRPDGLPDAFRADILRCLDRWRGRNMRG